MCGLLLLGTSPAEGNYNHNNGRAAQGFVQECWPPDNLIVVWQSYGQTTLFAANGISGIKHWHKNSFGAKWHAVNTKLHGHVVYWWIHKTWKAAKYPADYKILHARGYCAQGIPSCKMGAPDCPEFLSGVNYRLGKGER
jgi:hypothetical protein